MVLSQRPLTLGCDATRGHDQAPIGNRALTMAGGVLRKINANATKAARNRRKNASPAAWFTNRC